MDEQQFYQVVWGTKDVPAVGWGRKVFADPSLEARNASTAQRFFEERVRAGGALPVADNSLGYAQR